MGQNGGESCAGSLSAEAALVLPIFFFAMYALLMLFSVMELQDRLHRAAVTVGTELARYGWVLDYVDTDALLDPLTGQGAAASGSGEVVAEGGVAEALLESVQLVELLKAVSSEQYLRFRLRMETEDLDLARLCLKDGFHGISFSGSRVMDADGCITICMRYTAEIPLIFGYTQEFELRQTVRVRAFSGHAVTLRIEEVVQEIPEQETDADEEQEEKQEDEEQEEEEKVYVYIAARASVYHVSRKCTHLKLTILEHCFSELSGLRANGGGRYTACELCVKNAALQAEDTIYVCPEGDRYHRRMNCGGLTRSVTKCLLEEVPHLRKCSRCAKNEQS